MTQTAKTLLGGIGILVLVLALVAVANKNMNDNLEQITDSGMVSTSTPEISIDKHPDETATASSSAPGTPSMPTREASACKSASGTWDGEHHECTGITEGSCRIVGGTWDGCASPCRNNPNAESCIQMCAEVCTIK